MVEPLINREGQLAKISGKGGWTYITIHEILPDKHAHFGWVQVKGFIDDYELTSCKLMPMGNGQLFLPVKAAIRKRIKKEAGDIVRVILYADNDPVDIPQELIECLQDEPIAYERFIRYSEPVKKTIIQHIYNAKKDDTRMNRIADLINDLLAGINK